MNANQDEANSKVFVLKDELASLEGKNLNNVELGQEIQDRLLDRFTDVFPHKVTLDLNGNPGLEPGFIRATFADINSSFNKAVQKQGLLPGAGEQNILDYLELRTINLQLLWRVSHQIEGTLERELAR